MSTVASSLPHVSGRRRRTDRVMRAVLLIATLIALVPLVLIIYFLLVHGLKAWGGSFFTTDPNGNFFGNPGGIKSAIIGTLEIVALATIISVPIGIGVALYLVEYGKQSLFANIVRYFIDVMTGVPSIVFGLFIYIVLVISHTGGASFAAWKGAIAVALLMLPIVARSSEVVLMLVPDSLREAALALGAPRWRVVRRVVLPDGAAGTRHGIAAVGGPRDGGDRAAAVHRRRDVRDVVQPQRADEQPAASDLHRHHQPASGGDRSGLGRRVDPRRDHPDPEPAGPTRLSKEQHGMIPPETSSKDQAAMSTAGGPSERSQTEPRASKPTVVKKSGHSVNLKGLNAYYGSTRSIKDVTIDFPANEVTALIGPSGSGKSTVVRCINRMHEEIPGARAEGSVMLDDLDVYSPEVDVTAVRRAIGMVFQKPNPFPTMSIFDNVAAGLRLTGTKSGDLRDLVHRSLQSVGLWDEVKDRLNSPGIGLSGGQQQRLCIARTVAIEPEVILMDEPASALDPISTLKIEELIDELKERYTIVIVTHNMQQAARVANSTVFMLEGEVIEHDETNKIFTNPSDERTERYVTGKFG